MTFQEWQQQAQKMRAMADNSRASRRARLERVCREAGLAPMCVHNAMVGLHYGKPWREVDYSKAREAQRIERSMFDASRIVDRWHARVRPMIER